MAIPTPVNGQITDAVTQTNLSVLGAAPAQAMGGFYQAMAQTTAIGMQNATANQQLTNELASAVLTRCVGVLTSNGKK
jgi:hypothetical protein